MPTPMEEYLFDLHGYTIVKGALDPDHVRAMNGFLDALPSLEIDQWYGNIDVHTYKGIDGMNLQNIIEGGEIFERLIDHPAWIDLVRHYIGPHDRPFINEGFINIRRQGGYIGVHLPMSLPKSWVWVMDRRLSSPAAGTTHTRTTSNCPTRTTSNCPTNHTPQTTHKMNR